MADSPDGTFLKTGQKISEERWRRIDYLLHAALEREPTERAAFLKKACSDDGELYTEIESLLAFGGHENFLLEISPWPVTDLFVSAKSQAFPRGTRLSNGGSHRPACIPQ